MFPFAYFDSSWNNWFGKLTHWTAATENEWKAEPIENRSIVMYDISKFSVSAFGTALCRLTTIEQWQRQWQWNFNSIECLTGKFMKNDSKVKSKLRWIIHKRSVEKCERFVQIFALGRSTFSNWSGDEKKDKHSIFGILLVNLNMNSFNLSVFIVMKIPLQSVRDIFRYLTSISKIHLQFILFVLCFVNLLEADCFFSALRVQNYILPQIWTQKTEHWAHWAQHEIKVDCFQQLHIV